MRTAWALMVMPRSRSRSMESSTWACISRAVRDPVSSSRRSASVDLPWSMCAMMAKLRMKSGVYGCGGQCSILTGLGADTIVVVEETILGKPSDAEDAARMLRLLSGRVHRVITGVCVIGPVVSGQGSVASKPALCSTRSYSSHLVLENRELSAGSESTLVTMNELSGEEIWEYIRTGEPMDKAGAYAIQGLASRWIPRIEGDYSNVVGLPVAMVYEMLRGRRGEG
jgi:MAF protein